MNLIGLGLIGFIVWLFWLVKDKGVWAFMTSGGSLEQVVLVKRGHTPEVVVVEGGKPVRLNFVRQQSLPGPEMVRLPTFNKIAEYGDSSFVLNRDRVGRARTLTRMLSARRP